MTLKPIALFLSLGLAATVTACGGAEPEPAPEGAAPAEEAPAPEAEAPAAETPAPTESPADEGGEGGEG